MLNVHHALCTMTQKFAFKVADDAMTDRFSGTSLYCTLYFDDVHECALEIKSIWTISTCSARERKLRCAQWTSNCIMNYSRRINIYVCVGINYECDRPQMMLTRRDDREVEGWFQMQRGKIRARRSAESFISLQFSYSRASHIMPLCKIKRSQYAFGVLI